MTQDDVMPQIQRIIERLVKQHGGLRRAAEAVGINAPYLCRLRYGERKNPSERVLKKLGIKRVVSYTLT